MTDFRALCAELLEHLSLLDEPPHHIVCRAQEALAEPQGEGATEDPMVPGCYRGHEIKAYRDGFHSGYRHAICHRPAPPPADECPACEGQPAPNNTPCTVCGAERPATQPPSGEVAELVAWLRSLDWASAWFEEGSPEQRNLLRAADLLTRQALQPVPEESADTRYEFSVMDGDYVEQAGGSAPTLEQARDEGLRYLAQYSQDSPHTLELRRVEILPLPTRSENV